MSQRRMELVATHRSRTSSQTPSAIALIGFALALLEGPLISILLTLVDLPEKSCSSAEPLHGVDTAVCAAQWRVYVDIVLEGCKVWFLDWIPRVAASLLTLHLSACVGYIGLIHLGIIPTPR